MKESYTPSYLSIHLSQFDLRKSLWHGVAQSGPSRQFYEGGVGGTGGGGWRAKQLGRLGSIIGPAGITVHSVIVKLYICV